MKREQRLRSPADFRRVRDVARSGWAHPLLVLYMARTDAGSTRVGITVSGRVGKAVVRNRVRRRLRAALDARFDRLPPQADIVLVARPSSAEASWSELCLAVDTLLTRAEKAAAR